jgi:hypothetical protein
VRLTVSAQSLAAGSLELPASEHVPILAHDPSSALIRVTSFRPGIKHSEEYRTEFAESDVANYVSVVVRPTNDYWIESLDQIGLLLRNVSLDLLPQFLSVSFNRLWTRFDSGGTSDWLTMTVSVRGVFPSRILPYSETQEIEARLSLRHFQRVGYSRLLFVEFQPYLAQPLGGEFTTLLDHFTLFVQDHMPVG